MAMSLALIIGAGHSFFVAVLPIAGVELPHHDIANHEPVDDHATCPSEIHQFVHSNSAPDITGSLAICPEVSVHRLSLRLNIDTPEYLPPPRWDLPIDRKTTLLI